MLEQEINLSIKTKASKQLYMRMWWSDNEPADENNPGCIGITIFDEHMLELDGGELDYTDESIELRDMIEDCLEFMDIDADSVKETHMWKVNKKG